MCPVLKFHGKGMENVSEDLYLGDIISSDGKNRKNVDKRISKGLGLITQIMNLLEEFRSKLKGLSFYIIY